MIKAQLNQEQDIETSSGPTAGKHARAQNQSAMNILYVHKSIKYREKRGKGPSLHYVGILHKQ